MLIVDVFNVLHADGVLPPELVLHSVSDLVWILERSRYAGTPKVLVCDGVRPGVGHTAPSATRIGDARVLYSGAGREADYEIERLIEKSSYPARLMVVSTDRRIARAAKKRRTGYLRSDAFLKQLAVDADRRHAEPMPKWVHEIPLSRASVEHWLETFGLDEQDARSLAEAHASGKADPETVRRGEQAVSQQTPTGPAKPDPASPAHGSRRKTKPRKPAPSEGTPPPDAQLRELAREQGLDPDDLDMGRWLGERE